MSSERATNPRVAVDVLVDNQRDVLFRGAPDREPPLTPLVESFDDRRALINWWQSTCIRTFGYLSEFFPAQTVLREAYLVDALVGPDADAHEHTRERVLDKTIEASHIAYRDLEVRANEWLSAADDPRDHDDYTEIDPAKQSHIAMRPAFSALDTQQATALSALWAGFDDRQALTEWLHTLPAVADFSAVLDTSPVQAFAQSEYARTMLTSDTDDGAAYRERFAAGILLPAFGERARELRAGESVVDDDDDSGVPLA